MIDPSEFARRVKEEEDFIVLKRFNYSLESLRERYPDGCPDHVVAAALLVTEEDVEKLWQEAVDLLKDRLGVQGEGQ